MPYDSVPIVHPATKNDAISPSDRSEFDREPPPEVSAPDHPIVFFDGVCGLCDRAVDHILARDPKGTFRFAPLQGETAKRLLTPDDIQSLKSLVLVDDAGVHRRSTAVWRILWKLGGSQRFLGGLLFLTPWPVRDIGYRCVSAVRYRIFGQKETCRLPTPEERSRFLP